jgi:hypothetical protein
VRINHEGVVCGAVNGRGPTGAMTGFRKFIYYAHTGHSRLEPPNIGNAYTRAELSCRTAKNAEEISRVCGSAQALERAHKDYAAFHDRYLIDCK